jgi:hypothetical protein
MRTKDGDILLGATAEELITELRQTSYTPTTSNRQFMADLAHRTLLQNGRRIRTDNPDNFIADLIEAGLLYED